MKRLTALFSVLTLSGLLAACHNGTLVFNTCDSCECPAVDGDTDTDGDVAEQETESEELAAEEDFDLEWQDAPPDRLACADDPGNWIVRLGNAGKDWGSGLTRFLDGRLLLLGYYTVQIDLGKAHLTAPAAPKPRSAFLAAYDANGGNQGGRDLKSVFERTDPGTPLRPLMAHSTQDLAVIVAQDQADPNGRVQSRTLSFNAEADIQKTMVTDYLFSPRDRETPVLLGAAVADNGDLFVADGSQRTTTPGNVVGSFQKIKSDGSQAWRVSFTIGNPQSALLDERIPQGEKPFVIRPMPDGGAILGGFFKSNLFFGEQVRASYHDSWDIFLTRIDPDGAVLWLQTIGSPVDDWGLDIDLNTDDLTIDLIAGCGEDCLLSTFTTLGTLYVRYDANGRLIMGGGYGDRNEMPGQHHAILRDKSGYGYHWTDGIEKISADRSAWFHLPMPKELVVNSMVLDEAGGIYAAGYFTGEISLFCGTLKSAGDTDAFLMHVGTIPKVTTRRR